MPDRRLLQRLVELKLHAERRVNRIDHHQELRPLCARDVNEAKIGIHFGVPVEEQIRHAVEHLLERRRVGDVVAEADLPLVRDAYHVEVGAEGDVDLVCQPTERDSDVNRDGGASDLAEDVAPYVRPDGNGDVLRNGGQRNIAKYGAERQHRPGRHRVGRDESRSS